MATQITSVASTLHPGMYCNARYLHRCDNGVLWAVIGNRASERIEFWRSTTDGASWVEDTSQRITTAQVVAGHSSRHVRRAGGGERLVVIYRNSSTNKMQVGFGLLRHPHNQTFYWHSASPKNTSTQKASSNYKRPDIECWYNGRTWLCPTVWAEEPASSPGTARLYMGRTRFVAGDSFSVDEQIVHSRANMQSWPRPSAMIRHTGRRRDVYAASPDLFLGWHQGIDADPSDRGYMMRLVLSGSTWGVGTLRVMEQNGVQSGLTSGCYTGQRAAWAQVPSGGTEDILLHLMQPSDSSRDTLLVPAPGLGELENVSTTWDNYSGDIYILASGVTTQRPHYIRYDWLTRAFDGGGWQEINTDAVVADTLSARLGSDGSSIDCVYAVDTGSAYSFRFETVTVTNVAPDAATFVTQSGPADRNAGLVAAWNHNDADGDPQAQYEVRRSIDGATEEYWNGSSFQGSPVQPASAITQITVPAVWGNVGEIHELRARTNDGQAWGPLSASVSIQPADKVNPTIDAPSAGTYAEALVQLDWTVAEQSAYRVRLLDGGAVQLFDSDFLGSATVRSYTIPYLLSDGASYTVELTTKTTEGLASDAITVAITVNLTPPPLPVYTLVPNPDEGAMDIDIDNGTPDGGEDPADHNNIYRIDLDDPNADEVLVATNQLVDAVYTDRSIGSGRNYSWVVEAVTADGAALKTAHD